MSSMTLVTPWTVAHQDSLSMGFFRQEYWNGLPFSPPGDLPTPGIKPLPPTLQADSSPLIHQGYCPILFFCMWISGFASSIFEGTLLSPFCGLGTLVKYHLTRNVRVSLWALCSVPLVHSISLYTNSMLSWFLLLCVVYFLKSGYMRPPTLLFF